MVYVSKEKRASDFQKIWDDLRRRLPKTRSGKIMRRILRNIASDNIDDLGDISTLADKNLIGLLGL